MYYLGFDIGGSSLKAVLVKDKEIIKSTIKDLPNNLEDLLLLMKAIQADLSFGLDSGKISGVGISIPGPLDINKEKILVCPHIPFLGGQKRDLFSLKLNSSQLKIEHDVHCFLQAEKEIGLAKDMKDVFYVAIGTFVGSAFMINRQIFFGAHGAAGEAGWMVINAEKGQTFGGLTGNIFFENTFGYGAQEAFKRAQAGDKEAINAFSQVGKNLGIGLANIINSFDPEAIIINGGISGAKEFIIKDMELIVEKYVNSPAAKETKILFSELGRFGAALGAALLFI